MSKLKDLIQDEATLKSVIDVNLSEIVNRVKAALGALEEQYIWYRKRQKKGIVLVVIGFIVPNVTVLLSGAEVYTPFSFLLSFIMVVSGLYLSLSGKGFVDEFNRALDQVIYREIFTIFGLDGDVHDTSSPNRKAKDDKNEKPIPQWLTQFWRSTPSPEVELSRQRLVRSELITEPYNKFAVDTLATLEIAKKTLAWSEFSISHVTGSGKNRSEKIVFRGYFASIALSKILEGRTFVAAEGDSSNSSRTAFWKKDISETILEWNEFENLLHVATSNEVEARYVLTPNFMHSLYDWWSKQQGQIRLSFIGDTMYILFPVTKLRFNQTVEALSADELREYILSVAAPMLHVVHLAEEVRL